MTIAWIYGEVEIVSRTDNLTKLENFVCEATRNTFSKRAKDHEDNPAVKKYHTKLILTLNEPTSLIHFRCREQYNREEVL